MSSETETPSGAGAEGGCNAPPNSENQENEDCTFYECNICLDTAKDAVVSMCGHLFW